MQSMQYFLKNYIMWKMVAYFQLSASARGRETENILQRCISVSVLVLSLINGWEKTHTAECDIKCHGSPGPEKHGPDVLQDSKSAFRLSK